MSRSLADRKISATRTARITRPLHLLRHRRGDAPSRASRFEGVEVNRENTAARPPEHSGAVTAAEAGLIQQLRQGDADAGYRFMRDYYPGVYRYLLLLTGRPESAEDLAQETFLQAWRRLDRFEGRAPLRVWLHRIWDEPLQSLEELAGGVLRVEYTEPGWFEWRVPGHPYFQWIVPVGSGSQIRRATRPQIRERTRGAALEAARRRYPQGFEAEVQVVKQLDARFEAAAMVPQADQIMPTVLDLKIIYIPG